MDLVALFFLLVVLFVLAMKIRGQRSGQREPRPAHLFGLAVLLGLGLASYLMPGHLLGGDAHSHVGRTWLYREALRSGEAFSFWNNNWYTGFPLGLYYGPAYHFTAGLLSAAFPATAFFWVTKVLLWGLHVLSGLAMYGLTFVIGRSHFASLVASLCYAFSLQHLAKIQVGGMLPLSMIFVGFPLALYLWERRSREGATSATGFVLATSALLTLLILVHVQFGLLATLTFFSIAGWRSLYPGPGRKTDLRMVVAVGAGFACLSAWFLLPLAVEKDLLILGRTHPMALMKEYAFSFETLFKRLEHLVWSRTPMGYNTYYIGTVPVLLALASIGGLRRTREFRVYSLACLASLPLIVPNPRYVSIWLCLLAVVAARGVKALEIGDLFRRGRRWIQPLVLAMVLLDLGPGLLQRPYSVVDNHEVRTLQSQLDARGEVRRILTLAGGLRPFWSSRDVIGTNASSPFGGIPQMATTSALWTTAALAQLASEVIDSESEPSTASREALRLMNVGYVVNLESGEVLEITGASPVFFSARLSETQLPDDPLYATTNWNNMRRRFTGRQYDSHHVARTVATMQLHAEQPTAERLLLSQAAGSQCASWIDGVSAAPAAADFALTEIEETSSEVHLTYESGASGFLHLSYSYWPFNELTLDEEPVLGCRSATGWTVLKVPAGRHSIVLRPGISTLRRSLLPLPFAFLAVLLGIRLASFRAQRTRG